MTPEEQAAADVARHESDVQFLIQCGQALEAESKRRRDAGEDALDHTSAAAVVAGLST